MEEAARKDMRSAYYWEYDDNSYGMIVVLKNVGKSKKDLCVESGVYKNKEQLDARMTDLKKQSEDGSYQFLSRKIKIKNGLKYMDTPSDEDKDVEQGEYEKDELTKFLNSCGTDKENKKEVLRLFSGVLSGYCAQMIQPLMQEICPTPLQYRAPIVVLNSLDRHFNNSFDFVTKVARSLILYTETKSRLHTERTAVLPQSLNQHSIDQCAFMTYKKEKTVFPAQLRDTAVLIYGRFFSGNEIYRFIERNRWTACVLFDAPSKVYKVPSIRLKTLDLKCIDFSWDADAVKHLVGRFIMSLSKLQKKGGYKKKIKKRLGEIQDSFFRYYAQRGIQRYNPSDDYFIMLQMVTLGLFLDSCKDDKIINKRERNQVRAEWFNLLLPGCTEYLKLDDESIQEELETDEQRAKQTIEDLLTRILEKDNFARFPYVDATKEFEETAPDNASFGYWGYIYRYTPKRKKGQSVTHDSFWALVVKEKQFKLLLGDYEERKSDVDTLVDNLRSCETQYLYPAPSFRFNRGRKGKPEAALIFEIEKMNFLPEETISLLTSKGEILNGTY